MNQPIADLPPVELAEATSIIVWPSIGATPLGRLVGQLGGVEFGFGFFTLGKLFTLASIPLALVAYAWRLAPFVSRRYRLTNRRIVILKGLSGLEDRAIGLDEFDAVDIEVLPGQAWLRAGEVLFKQDGREVFRLSGIPWPQPFCQAVLKVQIALVSVREVCRQQAEAVVS